MVNIDWLWVVGDLYYSFLINITTMPMPIHEP